MKRAGIIHFLVGMLVLSFYNCTAAYASPASSLQNTKLIVYQPVLPKGPTTPGSCWTSSIILARAGAWRCMVGNSIYDPCFTTTNPNLLICQANPALKQPGFKLALTTPLPTETRHPKPLSNSAWLVQLQDNTLCVPLTGTMPIINDTPIGYSCSSSPSCSPHTLCTNQVGLLGPLQPGKPWTARKIIYSISANGRLQAQLLQTVPVKTVWQ